MTLILSERRVSKIDSMNRTWYRNFLVLSCDECNTQFERTGLKYAKKSLHFCSPTCAIKSNSPGGKLRSRVEATCKERFGSSSRLSSRGFKELSQQTCIVRYGVHHAGAARKFIEQRKKTCVEKYGVTSFLATGECRKALKAPETVSKRLLSISKIDWPLRNKKRHETMKSRGNYGKSSTEDAYYEVLCEKHGVDDIERQVIVNNNWSIDFYVKSIDTYVQFDGVYWHGLDRPIEEIKQFKVPRDVVIFRKWNTDRAQDDWFLKNGLKLIRVIDDSSRLHKISL